MAFSNEYEAAMEIRSAIMEAEGRLTDAARALERMADRTMDVRTRIAIELFVQQALSDGEASLADLEVSGPLLRRFAIRAWRMADVFVMADPKRQLPPQDDSDEPIGELGDIGRED